MKSLIDIARETFALEAREISKMADFLDADFEKACEAILQSEGRVVVAGIGKSGLIGKKISATLASTGVSSFFLHPTDAFHGDLGMIRKEDVIISISNSGETSELLRLIPFIQNMRLPHIAILGNIHSTLAKHADYVLNASVDKEACPLQLAPTASTTNALVMGDALAVALMEARNFKREDFAQFHPGGNLGKRLLGKVRDYMIADNLPILHAEANGETIIDVITRGKLGLAIVLDRDIIAGVITDGDLRRALHTGKASFFEQNAKAIMTPQPKVVSGETSLLEAEGLMNDHKITSLLVAENGALKGVIQIYQI
ncbi:MAG: SIS domain-containing protein [Bacteroidia bacterium]